MNLSSASIRGARAISELESLDWLHLACDLDAEGYAVISSLVDAAFRKDLMALYDGPQERFRATIDMARYNFGQGQYKYFSYPLPVDVQRLREAFYPPLAKIANTWAALMGIDKRWPRSHSEFTDQCHAAGQSRPTPLLLRYAEGDYNCLHQDLYGEIYFPLQIIILLSDPGSDFEGGELTLVEQRPRVQSRPMVVPLAAGDAVIIPTRERPRQGKLRMHRVQMRHGVSRVRRGQRMSLGIIFHDAT